MKRWIAVAVAATGCDGATQFARDGSVDAEIHQLAPFTPLICTSGDPGEPTCPINHVDVSDIAAGAQMQFLAVPGSTRVFLHDIELTAGASGLFVRDLRFVVYREGVAITQIGPLPPVIELAAGESFTLDAAGLPDFTEAGAQLGLQYGATQ